MEELKLVGKVVGKIAIYLITVLVSVLLISMIYGFVRGLTHQSTTLNPVMLWAIWLVSLAIGFLPFVYKRKNV